MWKRFRWPMAVLAAVVLAALAAAVVLSSRALAPRASGAPGHGEAASATGSVGFTVDVVGEDHRDGLLVLQLRFTNTSKAQQRADPRDFTLQPATGGSAGPVFATGCPNWGRVDLYPTADQSQPQRDPGGTRAGPTWEGVLCFRDPSTTGPVHLVWSPDVAFGPLSGTVVIALPSPPPS